MPILIDFMIAKRLALFCSRSFAKGMADNASLPNIKANKITYSGWPVKLRMLAMFSEKKQKTKIKLMDEITSEIKIVEYTASFSISV